MKDKQKQEIVKHLKGDIKTFREEASEDKALIKKIKKIKKSVKSGGKKK